MDITHQTYLCKKEIIQISFHFKTTLWVVLAFNYVFLQLN